MRKKFSPNLNIQLLNGKVFSKLLHIEVNKMGTDNLIKLDQHKKGSFPKPEWFPNFWGCILPTSFFAGYLLLSSYSIMTITIA